MMKRLASLVCLLGLASCSGSDPLSLFGAKAGVAKADDTVGKFFAGPALWDDPQNTPHPMFNWPTVSHPPVGDKLPPLWKPIPVRALPAPVSGLQHVAHAEEVVSGGGMAVFGSLAVVPGFGETSSVVDLSDPAKPKRIGTFNQNGGRSAPLTSNQGYGGAGHGVMEAAGAGADRGAAIIAYPSGRLVAVLSTDSFIESLDITDPRRPRRLPPLQTPNSHKVGVVPGTPIVYNAGSRGGGTGSGNIIGMDHTEIFDLSDPDDPQFVQDFQNGYSCHHIFFWNNVQQNKFRAVCAGIEVTQIWDTADPRDPKVLVTIPVHHGVAGTPSAGVILVAFSHSAGLNRDGTVLYVGDENGGGSLPPGCVASVDTPAGSVSVPIGAVWFYDISTETMPLLQGWYSAAQNPSALGRSCTAHHGRLVPDPNRDLLAMAFYGDGVLLIDFSNPTLPKLIDQFADNSNTWEAWYHNGYIITGDLVRGLDVLTFQ
ncbi:MAG: hypothetical protein AABY95_05510 [Pseudomonadota bacterium]